MFLGYDYVVSIVKFFLIEMNNMDVVVVGKRKYFDMDEDVSN